VSCGSKHLCTLFENGTVECHGGTNRYNEAMLTKDMSNNVFKVKAGKM